MNSAEREDLINELYVLLMVDISRKQKERIIEKIADKINLLEQQKDNAYKERNLLVNALTRFYPSHISRHPEEDDWEDDWRNIVFIETPEGQLSWHIHDSEISMFAELPFKKNNWDGHNTKQKYKRLKKLGLEKNND